MPQRYEMTPPWGKKRKRELSSSPSPPPPDASVPREHEEIKRLKTEQGEAHLPWAKHSDPPSPSSLASSAAWRSSKNDDLTKAVKAMFDWTRSDEAVEESIRHMRRIVSLCQDEASWSGLKNWKRAIATYQSLGASPEDINDLIEAREPFWTQTRVRHVSSTLATPRALADSIRTMVEESERNNGRYLDRELKYQLMKAVDRVFPLTPPVLVSSQATAFQHSHPPIPGLSQVIKPKQPTRFAAEAARPVNTETSRNERPPSPSASPKPTASAIASPIQFNIATGWNSASLRRRPRLGLDVDIASISSADFIATPSSATSAERRKASALTNIQPPTRPRSLPLFPARITPQEPLDSITQQKKEILNACNYKKVPAQNATPCPSNDGSWVLHFKDIKDLQMSLGKWTILRDISIPVLTYAPGQSFQMFGSLSQPDLVTSGVIDVINTLARTFCPRKFTMRRQMRRKHDPRTILKWLVIFEEPLDRENLNLDMTTVAEVRDTLELFGLSSSENFQRCWVCSQYDHIAAFCNHVERIKPPHEHSQLLTEVPLLVNRVNIKPQRDDYGGHSTAKR